MTDSGPPHVDEPEAGRNYSSRTWIVGVAIVFGVVAIAYGLANYKATTAIENDAQLAAATGASPSTPQPPPSITGQTAPSSDSRGMR